MRTIAPAPRRAQSRRGSRDGAHVTLEQLRSFVAVADAEHVTAAAERLRLSQGSVSAAVHRLEQVLGVPLFHRVGRNVRLTDVGRAVRLVAARTLEDAAEIEKLSAGYAAYDRGEISIASGRVTGAHLLSEWLAPFVEQHPGIDVHISLGSLHDVVALLHAGAADVVFMGTDVREAGMETLVLESTPLVAVVACTHPLAASPSPLDELHRHRYLAHDGGTATQTLASRLIGTEALGATIMVLEEGALRAALLSGIGFAVLPQAAVKRELADGRLVTLPTRGPELRQNISAARRLGVTTPAAAALWNHLAALAA